MEPRAVPGRWMVVGAGAVAGLMAARGAAAQPAGARALEEGVGDVGPLSVGLRLMQRDMRRPFGFDRVFEVDRSTAFGTEQTLIRIDGAVTAVFPRSTYRIVGPGVLAAEFPAGTVFHIGELPAEFGSGPEATRTGRRGGLAASLAVDLSARAGPSDSAPRLSEAGRRSGPPAPDAQPRDSLEPGAAEPPSIWTDEHFRRLWLAEVLRSVRATRGAGFP